MELLFILLSLPLLYSFKFNPMSQSIDLSEKQTTVQFSVENQSPESMAIELTVKGRTMNEDGHEELPADANIAIFPPQMIIPSKEKRTVRVTWNGSKKIESEKAFRVIAEQLPLKLNEKAKKATGIQMLMKYMAALYVTPDNAKSSLAVTLSSVSEDSLSVVVRNDGTKHQILNHPVVTFMNKENKWTFKEAELPGLAGENVLARSGRKFTIKTTQKIPKDSVVTIKVDD